MRKMMRVRAHDEQESGGLDAHVHGEDAYRMKSSKSLDKIIKAVNGETSSSNVHMNVSHNGNSPALPLDDSDASEINEVNDNCVEPPIAIVQLSPGNENNV